MRFVFKGVCPKVFNSGGFDFIVNHMGALTFICLVQSLLLEYHMFSCTNRIIDARPSWPVLCNLCYMA